MAFRARGDGRRRVRRARRRWRRSAHCSVSHRAEDAHLHTLRGSVALFLQAPIVLCFAYFVVQTMAGVGLQTFMPTALNAGLDVPLAARDLGADRVSASAAWRASSPAASSPRAPRATIASRRPGSRRAALLLVAIALGVLTPVVLPVFAIVGFALGSTGPSRDLIVRGATPKGAAGRVYGFVYSGLDLGGTLGPIWFGFMLDHCARARNVLRGCRVLRARDRHGLSGAARERRRRAPLRRSDLTMDLGIAGRRALVCAASKGLGRGCAQALAEAGCEVTIVARTEDTLRRAAEEIGARAGRHGAPRRLRHHDAGRTGRRARGLRRARHPDQQRRRSAARRLPRLGPRRVAPRARRQHADADRAHQGDDRRHDRAQVRPHRQHHVVGREGADRYPRTVQRCALGTHRVRRRARAQGRRATT